MKNSFHWLRQHGRSDPGRGNIRVLYAEPRFQRQAVLKKKYKVAFGMISDAVKGAGVVILAVKPQDIPDVPDRQRPQFSKNIRHVLRLDRKNNNVRHLDRIPDHAKGDLVFLFEHGLTLKPRFAYKTRMLWMDPGQDRFAHVAATDESYFHDPSLIPPGNTGGII